MRSTAKITKLDNVSTSFFIVVFSLFNEPVEIGYHGNSWLVSTRGQRIDFIIDDGNDAQKVHFQEDVRGHAGMSCLLDEPEVGSIRTGADCQVRFRRSEFRISPLQR